jgi:hypothetical protein
LVVYHRHLFFIDDQLCAPEKDPHFDRLGSIARLWRDVLRRSEIYLLLDGWRFGKYCFISLRRAWVMPLKASTNLLVQGSNPCGTSPLLIFSLSIAG